MAKCVMTSVTAARSARAPFKNALRAGTLSKRRSTTTVVPLGSEAGESSASAPPSTTTLVPAPSPVEVVRQKDETLAMEGRASPLKPRVLTDSMSLMERILLVACLSTERRASSVVMPDPSDRKSVVLGKSVDIGGRRIIKKKKKESST